MSIIKRIQELLECTLKVPLYDQSEKIINPAGVEAIIEARGIKKCLKIAEEEKRRESLQKCV